MEGDHDARRPGEFNHSGFIRDQTETEIFCNADEFIWVGLGGSVVEEGLRASTHTGDPLCCDHARFSPNRRALHRSHSRPATPILRPQKQKRLRRLPAVILL